MAEEQIKRNEQTIKELDEEAKEKEKKETKLMNRKNPDFSLGWTIGDTRWYMISFQLIVAAVSGFVLVTTYTQMSLDSEGKNICNENENIYDRPYDSATEGCPWPMFNVIIRIIGAGIGLIFALITLVLSYWKGKLIQNDMNTNNDKRELVKKLEYFDIYNQFCMFKFMRYVLGYCGYLQFISVGFDTYSFLAGDEYASNVLNISNNKSQFLMMICISLIVAILLRVSHDSMYQRVYKHKLKLNFGYTADKGYAGATIVDKDNNDAIIQMCDTSFTTNTN
eukprot:62286_1